MRSYSVFSALVLYLFFFFSSRRRHTRYWRDWSSDVCSSDLEAALERLVLLDVLAILVQRRGADAAQLAARQRRLEHVGRVLRALGGAGSDERSEERRVGKECRSRWSPYH